MDKDKSQAGGSDLEAVASRIEAMIADGALVPGQRLIEADLARELGVSRSAIREALRFLAGDGVVELQPQRGARVRKIDRTQLAEMLEVFGRMCRIGMEFLASLPITPETRNELIKANDRIELAVSLRSGKEIARCMLSYHEIIADRCGNSFYAHLQGRLRRHHYAIQAADIEDIDNMVRSAEDYKNITSYLLQGNAQAAFEILLRHIDRTVSLFRDGAVNDQLTE